MSLWAWIAVGAIAFLVIGAVLALAVATVLGRIAENIMRFEEQEHWASTPLTRQAERVGSLAAPEDAELTSR
jgi:hypothetical protein